LAKSIRLQGSVDIYLPRHSFVPCSASPHHKLISIYQVVENTFKHIITPLQQTMLYSNVIALYLAAVSAFHSPQISEGFTILRPLHSRGVTTSPLSLWVDDQHGFSTSKTATECVDMQAKACLKSSCDVEHMSILLQKLEKIQNDCTEEGRYVRTVPLDSMLSD
jgi:hypothetical protein